MGRLRGLLGGNRIAFVLERDFDGANYTELRGCLGGAGANVMVVSSDSWSEITDRDRSLSIKPDLSFMEAEVGVFDVLVIGDDSTARQDKSRPDACRLVSETMRFNKPLVAVGLGPELLICANALKGRKVTGLPSIADAIRLAGGMFKKRSVVIDGNLITARSSGSVGKICDLLAPLLRGRSAEAA
ncbi:MAG: DJ-1/PfpI family protein [Actinobacteria bacterium]|nr:DJ-1/PfpI family protein [Actinomycetota bacterium]